LTMSLLEYVQKRTSIRAIDSAPIPEGDIIGMLESARWSASWGNLQPWRLIVVRDPATLAALSEAYTRGNAWAARAPVIFVMVSSSRLGKSRGDEPFYLFDCGLAAQSLILEAATRSLVAHPFGGWDDEVVSRVIGLPSDMRVVVLIAAGREGSLDDLDAITREKAERPQTRRPISEIASADRWERPFTAAEEAD
jgi:nitroreductase